jgi:hypothetical protein
LVPEADFLPANFWTKCPEKPAKAATTDSTDRWKPALRLALLPPCGWLCSRPVSPDVGRPMFLGLQGSSKGSFCDNARVAIFDSHNDVDGVRAGRF